MQKNIQFSLKHSTNVGCKSNKNTVVWNELKKKTQNTIFIISRTGQYYVSWFKDIGNVSVKKQIKNSLPFSEGFPWESPNPINDKLIPYVDKLILILFS